LKNRLSRVTAFSAVLLASVGMVPAHAAPGTVGTNSCWGPMKVQPKTVPIGTRFSIAGRDFDCKSPNGKLLPSAAVIFYQPKIGFYLIQIKVEPNGSYKRSIAVPRKLRAMSTLLKGGNRRVATKPGTYYLVVRLFDVSIVPPSQADAHIKVIAPLPSTS
jgi:hypothetical protein